MTATRKPSMPALVRQLAKDGVPLRVRQMPDGETIIDIKTIVKVLKNTNKIRVSVKDD